MKSPGSQLDLFAAHTAVAPRKAPPGLGAAVVPEELHRLASHLPPWIHLGTSSWSFPGWRGIVYDGDASEARLAREGLAAYAQHPLLRTVGIDRTYYAPISAAAFERYAASVPADFRFLVKAHEMCTWQRIPHHPRYGALRGQNNERFLHAGYAAAEVVGPCIDGLGDKLGVLLFQFAPQPIGGFGDPAAFAARLHEFLRQLPRGPLYAVELRNPELLTERYAAALRDAGATHCLNVHPTMASVRTQATLTLSASSPAVVIRWMLRSGLRYEEAKARYAPFDRLVDQDPRARDAIADLCRRAVQRGRAAYVIINNKAEGSAPLSAFQLAAAIAAAPPTESAAR